MFALCIKKYIPKLLQTEFEFVDHRAGKIVVELNGRLNKCGVISLRFDIGVKDIEGWTARLLPSRQSGNLLSCRLAVGIWLHCADHFSWHHGPTMRRPEGKMLEEKYSVSFTRIVLSIRNIIESLFHLHFFFRTVLPYQCELLSLSKEQWTIIQLDFAYPMYFLCSCHIAVHQ
nr:40S ribosomal protein S15a-1 [Ipomoea batatas]